MWRVGGIPDSGCWVSGSSAASRFLRWEGRYTHGSTSSPWPRRDLWPSQRDSHGSAASVQHAERSGRHAPERITLLSHPDLLTGELLHSATAPRRFLPRRFQTGAGSHEARAGPHQPHLLTGRIKTSINTLITITEPFLIWFDFSLF